MASNSTQFGHRIWVKGKALSILAAKLGRAVYLILSKERVFGMEKFLARAG